MKKIFYQGRCICGEEHRVKRNKTTGNLESVRHFKCDQCGRDVIVEQIEIEDGM